MRQDQAPEFAGKVDIPSRAKNTSAKALLSPPASPFKACAYVYSLKKGQFELAYTHKVEAKLDSYLPPAPKPWGAEAVEVGKGTSQRVTTQRKDVRVLFNVRLHGRQPPRSRGCCGPCAMSTVDINTSESKYHVRFVRSRCSRPLIYWRSP